MEYPFCPGTLPGDAGFDPVGFTDMWADVRQLCELLINVNYCTTFFTAIATIYFTKKYDRKIGVSKSYLIIGSIQ